jgi:hypothetical protein
MLPRATQAAARKFVVDLEGAEDGGQTGYPQTSFLMMRGAGGGRAAVALEEQEEAEAAAAEAMEELMGTEMARLARLAQAVA